MTLGKGLGTRTESQLEKASAGQEGLLSLAVGQCGMLSEQHGLLEDT